MGRKKCNPTKINTLPACAVIALMISLIMVGCSESTASSDVDVQLPSPEPMHVVTPYAEEDSDTISSENNDESLVKNNLSMEVHFIDVGEGDSTLIKCGEETMLIDAGDASMGTTVRLYLKKQGVDHLKYLLLTHSDRDHIGGAASVISNIDIDEIFMCRYEKDNDVYLNLLNEIDYKSMTWRTPDVGEILTLGDSEITVVAPNREYDNPNDSSIAVIIRHGDNSFLFTGDAETSAEEDILANGLDISADIYKVGHHGSRTATSQAFLNAVNPSYAIISCSAGNDYGHPHIETLEKLKNKGTLLYRTDMQGTIVALSDGKEITFDKQPTDDWSEGSANDAESASIQVKQMALATPEVEESSSEEESIRENEGLAAEVTEPNDGVTDRSLPITYEVTYVANTNTKKFHRPNCDGVTDIKQKNRWDTTLTRDELIEQGYEPCQRCNP